MMKSVSLAAGLALGYVLGARAGREKYDELVAKARDLAGRPPVARARDKVRDTVAELGRAETPTAGGTSAARPARSTSGTLPA